MDVLLVNMRCDQHLKALVIVLCKLQGDLVRLTGRDVLAVAEGLRVVVEKHPACFSIGILCSHELRKGVFGRTVLAADQPDAIIAGYIVSLQTKGLRIVLLEHIAPNLCLAFLADVPYGAAHGGMVLMLASDKIYNSHHRFTSAIFESVK